MRAASLCGRTERSLPRRSESSWLLAQNELQKINQYKAPRDKLVCVLNCCRIINNLLSASASTAPPVRAAIALPRLRRSRRAPVQGADDFLPVLVLVLLRAAPTQLASNLAYIARFRLASRLVSETSYFYTNLVSAAVRALAGLAAAQEAHGRLRRRFWRRRRRRSFTPWTRRSLRRGCEQRCASAVLMR